MKNLSGASGFRMKSSREDLDKENLDSDNCDLKSEPLVTFPDPDTPPPATSSSTLSSPNFVSNMTPNSLMANGVGHLGSLATNHMVSSSASSCSAETVKFEQKRMTSASKTKLLSDSFTSEQGLSNSGSEVKRVQTSDISYQEQMAASALRSRLEIEGVTAEKSTAVKQVGQPTIYRFLSQFKTKKKKCFIHLSRYSSVFNNLNYNRIKSLVLEKASYEIHVTTGEQVLT